MDSPDPFTPTFSASTFQGIPNRTLPDDCMEYTLFLPSLLTSPLSAKARLETIQPLAKELAAKWSEGYIWQREGVWDAVDDEWFVVWMLRELSARFADLWIRVYDTDGEFLLIEAANALPKWLNPEIADHRVWINSTRLLIVPLSAVPSPTTTTTTRTAPISRPLTLTEALSTLHTYTTTIPPLPTLTHIRLVEEESFYRTTRYPSAAAHNTHHALTTLPRPLAHLLHMHPATIAAAVEAFYLRDPISLKSLTPMTHFPPTDPVTVSTKFTKTLYAQLKAQSFTPPPSACFPPSTTTTNNALDIGTKLTSGFEMLLSDATAPQLLSPSRQRTISTIRTFLASPPTPPPTDAEIAATWPTTADSEEWLDVDYAHGVEGAEVEGDDEMDVDDELNSGDDDEEEDDEEGEEDREVSFDEREFERMMREMMGMPVSTLERERAAEAEDDGEEAEIRKVMRQVEAELREAGALETSLPKLRVKEVDNEDAEEEEDNAELDIDYALAANMLESFKGQGGLAGPGGNLLARMGMGLPPRDEGDHQDSEKREIGGERMK
ncbi:uncharacterized protein LAJ45_05501 [Morchella importuna]|uniref:uncharacterized protein n=1 Tax=Morchella importuna TaxID=1174673 RepID=UPI001E8DB997|nr:uncharacterized protein LAJ45_05501 [Morchella importuna]KAH8150290.1 hypothetical protein LAJ45_05501 [Morchella importuna]